MSTFLLKKFYINLKFFQQKVIITIEVAIKFLKEVKNMKENTIGARIAKRRKELGMSQEELAFKVGYTSRSTINKIESSRGDITTKRATMLARALDCSVAYLMGNEEEAVKNDKQGYYFSAETARAAQDMFQNKELRALFDVQRDMDKEDLKAMYNIALALKRKERHDE